MNDNDQLLTLPEAADYLRTPVATLRWWRYNQVGPRSLKVGRKVMYWLSDLRAWLEQQGGPASA